MTPAQSQQAKMQLIAGKFGLTGRGQSTQRIIYDSVVMAGTGATTLSFFENFAGKTLVEANLTEGKLNASEMMVIKDLSLRTLFGEDIRGLEPLVNVFVGGQRVVKDYPLIFHGAAGVNPEPLYNEEAGKLGFRLLTNIVIPPQVDFRVDVRLSAQLDAEILYCKLGGLGLLFDPKTSL
jgi:hypothetical protein